MIASTHLDSVLIKDAVKALFKHESNRSETNKPNLLGDGAKWVLVQIHLKNSIKHTVQKPIRVKIPHAMLSPDEDENSICLFCKSTEKETIEKYLETNKITGLKRVLSLNDVKKYYKEFKNRKQLLSEHTHFVCNSSIARELYNQLGNVFSSRNQYPVQIHYDTPEMIEKEVNKVITSTYLHYAGSNITIKIGLTSMTTIEVSDNILAGIEFAVGKFQNGWKDVNVINLKTKDSAALPIYSKLDNEMLTFVKNKIEASKTVVADANSNKDKVKTPAKKVTKKVKTVTA